MKLALKDISKRASIKIDKSITVKDLKGVNVRGYMKFGSNNDYPQIMERLINNSMTAKSVSKIYSKFLAGNGFNEAVNNVVIGTDSKGKPITVIKLLRQCCTYISKHYGCFIHVNITLDGKVKNVRPIPFKNCRFASGDDNGYHAFVGVYENWEKDSDKVDTKGRVFDKTKIRWYNIFNLNPEVYTKQIASAGDVNNFKGQVYFHFLDDDFLYPLSPFDPVALDCDTEYQVEVYMNNQTRNGMTKKTVMRMVEPQNKEDEEALQEEVKAWQGTDGNNTLVLYDEVDPTTGELKTSGAFKVDQIDSNIDDEMFSEWGKKLTNNIRKAVNALPAILIDYEESKLGTTSGEAIIQATKFYNAMTLDDRKSISEMFRELLSKFDDPILSANQDWEIKELELYGNPIVQPAAGN